MTASPPQRRRLPKRSAEQTRELMLRAATNLVRAGTSDDSEKALSAALAHVRLTEVATEATRIIRAELEMDAIPAPATGITTGAIYQIWPTQADFQTDLLFYIATLNATSGSLIDELRPMIEATATSGAPVAEALRLTITTSFEYTRSSPLFYASLSFYMRAANERVQDVLRSATERFIEEIRPVYELLLSRFRLRIRPPYSIDDLSLTIAALLDGFALEWTSTPERTADPAGEPGWSLVTRTAQLLFDQMTRPADGA